MLPPECTVLQKESKTQSKTSGFPSCFSTHIHLDHSLIQTVVFKLPNKVQQYFLQEVFGGEKALRVTRLDCWNGGKNAAGNSSPRFLHRLFSYGRVLGDLWYSRTLRWQWDATQAGSWHRYCWSLLSPLPVSCSRHGKTIVSSCSGSLWQDSCVSLELFESLCWIRLARMMLYSALNSCAAWLELIVSLSSK